MAEARSKIAAELGTEFARMLHGIIPKIEEALTQGQMKASFTATAKFNVNEKTGGVDVILSQTASIPMPSTAFKLNYNSNQLSLFDPAPAE